ncbi:MAG: transaminase [Candidatus Nanopelagicales bacterium]|jgi:glutamate-1-semialdehyde 2,1-aminomutase|nr:transaminase [Candidatus Nanopelagicales bacterium]MDP4907754.1 transaminase [Candidatus Nanopelagicales bacterium]MDP4976021.1 transaminase [Candidatus Nanopelagicales bacterium]
MGAIDRVRLTAALEDERALHVQRSPRSKALYDQADHLFGRVPMTWMNKWAGGHPIYLATARGNRITDVDGCEYVDFALGDTGAMAGHSPEATVKAVQQRIGVEGGITTMMPSADAEWVAADLTRRFGLPLWSFALTATDANRWALRLARMVTDRPRVAAFSYCYHGSVDETFVQMGPDGETQIRQGNVGAPSAITDTTRAVEFNDLASVERALAHGDVAVLIMEPALTNIGIVLPEPGFLEGVTDLCRQHGTLLLIDETHTISAGPGGCTRAWGLDPDILVIGKSIGGGIPSGAYGITERIAEMVKDHPDADLIDVGGVGGTLAGNVLSTAAMRATLEEVLTDAAFEHMIALATRFTEGVEETLVAFDVPWSISQLGARAEYRFARPAPRTGTESAHAEDEDLDEYLHLFMANRGVLMTPFHNMALMCPTTTATDVDLHTTLFAEAVRRLVA